MSSHARAADAPLAIGSFRAKSAAVSLVLTFAVGAYCAAHALGLDGSVGTGMTDGAASLALVTLGFFLALTVFAVAESVRWTAELLAYRRRA